MNAEILTQLSDHLAAPDPMDLPSRGHRLTQEGDPERFELLAWLPDAYEQHLLVAMDDRRVPRPRLS